MSDRRLHVVSPLFTWLWPCMSNRYRRGHIRGYVQPLSQRAYPRICPTAIAEAYPRICPTAIAEAYPRICPTAIAEGISEDMSNRYRRGHIRGYVQPLSQRAYPRICPTAIAEGISSDMSNRYRRGHILGYAQPHRRGTSSEVDFPRWPPIDPHLLNDKLRVLARYYRLAICLPLVNIGGNQSDLSAQQCAAHTGV